MAKALVVANWKMNPKNFREAKRLLETTRKIATKAKQVTIVVAPPSIYLRPLAKDLGKNKLAFAAQTAHFESSGAYTGEISMDQAKDSGASYVLVGHAERRAMGESNEDTGKKVAAAFAAGLTPILCVGEHSRSKDGGYFEMVGEQIRAGLRGLPAQKATRVIIAYEPLWAIGSSEAISPADMYEMAIFIRKTAVALYEAAGHKIKILYGGSVDGGNANVILKEGHTTGLLVGRASTNADEFAALISAVEDL